jgi:DNA-binding HxlR family transcriptional regulator
MGASYHQFCPVSKAMELLDERWTLLVLRELLVGSEHFNDLRRGLPRMSPSLLSKRLRQLARAGIVDKRDDNGEVRYLLTSAGRELRPIIESLGAWGTRWIGELGDEDLDPQLLLWDMHRNIDHSATPAGRTVVQLQFPDLPAKVRDWWLVITPGEADVCDTDPGYPVTVTLTATLRHMTQVWRGDLSWPEALRTGAMEVRGPEELRRAAPGWFTLSPFASVPRPGDERYMLLPACSFGHNGNAHRRRLTLRPRTPPESHTYRPPSAPGRGRGWPPAASEAFRGITDDRPPHRHPPEAAPTLTPPPPPPRPPGPPRYGILLRTTPLRSTAPRPLLFQPRYHQGLIWHGGRFARPLSGRPE